MTKLCTNSYQCLHILVRGAMSSIHSIHSRFDGRLHRISANKVALR